MPLICVDNAARIEAALIGRKRPKRHRSWAVVRKRPIVTTSIDNDFSRSLAGYLEGHRMDFALNEDIEGTEAEVKDDHEVIPIVVVPHHGDAMPG